MAIGFVPPIATDPMLTTRDVRRAGVAMDCILGRGAIWRKSKLTKNGFRSTILSLMSKHPRINDQIRSPSVRLIDEEGEPLGVVLIERAKEMAREQEVDLVEVAPNAQPPVCKLMDYGKYMYRQQKMERKHKAQQKQTEVKGIRISLRTGVHDLEVKAKQAKKFLAERNMVKVVLMFRGREAAHLNLGRDKLDQLYAMLQDVAKIEDPAKRQGNQLIMMLAPGGTSVANLKPAAPAEANKAQSEPS